MSKKGNTLIAFLAGAAAGAILGILYAPDKGSNTREKLSFKLDKYKKTLEDFVNDLVSGKETPLTTQAKSQGNKVASEAKNKAERLLEDVDELFDENNQFLLDASSYSEQNIDDLIGPLTPPRLLTPPMEIPKIEIGIDLPNANFETLLAQVHLLTQEKDFFYLHKNKVVTVETLLQVREALSKLQTGEDLK